jgi:hypothetical protein
MLQQEEDDVESDDDDNQVDKRLNKFKELKPHIMKIEKAMEKV